MSKAYNSKDNQPKAEADAIDDHMFDGRNDPNAFFFSNTSHHTQDIIRSNCSKIYQSFVHEVYPMFEDDISWDEFDDEANQDEDMNSKAYANIRKYYMHHI